MIQSMTLLAVTRMLGRTLVPPEGGSTRLTHRDVTERLGTDEIYAALDYDVVVDPARP